MRVIYDQKVTMPSGIAPSHRRSDPPARLVVGVVALDVLIGAEPPRFDNLLAVPLGLHQRTRPDRIPQREGVVVARGQPARPRRPQPLPGWPEHGRDQALARPR